MAKRVQPIDGAVYERMTGTGSDQKGTGQWYVRYSLDGRLVRKSFKSNIAAANEFLIKVRAMKRDGTGMVPASARQPLLTHAEAVVAVKRTTIAELCEDALKFSKRHHRDKINPEARLDAIKVRFGPRQAESVMPMEIASWLDSLKRSAGTMNRYRSTFSLLYREGLKNGKVTVNPARLIPQQRIVNTKIRFLQPAEEKRLRAVIAKRFPHHMPELDIALNTGLRKGEQYGLEWANVDMDRCQLTLLETKNGTPRFVMLNRTAMAALQQLREKAQGKHVFNIAENRTWWALALKDAKIDNFRWHDLRHTFCTRLAENNASLKDIQEAAGHKSIVMSMRYTHVSEERLRSVVGLLEHGL